MLSTTDLRKFVHDISNSLMHLGGKISLLKMDPSKATLTVLEELESTATNANGLIRNLREKVRELQLEDPLMQLTYVSEARVDGATINEALWSIEQKASAFNQTQGITGFLIYHNGFFFQRIEGHKRNLESLYMKICKDVRHKSITLLSCEEIEDRGFSHWDKMYSLSLDDSDNEEVLGIIQGATNGTKLSISNSEALVLMNHVSTQLELA